ncbi:MAG: MFS transporter, partial [Acidimicrobiia bacterium]|nr:MFS transporter [Acidimicrobiia bacterium]
MTDRFDRGRAFRALNHQEFRSVYVAQLSTQLGFWGSHVSLQKLMTDIGDDDPTLQGLLFFFLFIPALVVTPFTSPLADRLDRRRLLMTGYLIIVAWASC